MREEQACREKKKDIGSEQPGEKSEKIGRPSGARKKSEKKIWRKSKIQKIPKNICKKTQVDKHQKFGKKQ